MEFAIKNEFTGFAKLIPGTVDYLQAMPENDLYFIQDTRSLYDRLFVHITDFKSVIVSLKDVFL